MIQARFIWAVNFAGVFRTSQHPLGIVTSVMKHDDSDDKLIIRHDFRDHDKITITITIDKVEHSYHVVTDTLFDELIRTIRNHTKEIPVIKEFCDKYFTPV